MLKFARWSLVVSSLAVAVLFSACGGTSGNNDGGNGGSGGGSSSGGGSASGGGSGGSGGATGGGSGGGSVGGGSGGSGGGSANDSGVVVIPDGGNFIRVTVNGTPWTFAGQQPYPLSSLPQVSVTPGFSAHSCNQPECFELSGSRGLPYMGITVDYRDAGVPGQNYYCWVAVWNELAGGYRQSAPNGTCTVQLTNVPHAVGETWEGTFSGTLKAYGAGADGGDIVFTNGDFRARRPY